MLSEADSSRPESSFWDHSPCHGDPWVNGVVINDDDGFEIVLSPTVAVAEAGPDLGDDWAWVGVSQTAVIDVLGNDHDPNENLDASSLRITVGPASGTAAVVETADGAAAVQYTAAALGGSDSVTYEVCDALGECDTAQVTIMVGNAGCTITGTEGDDMLQGTSGDDVICGLGGNDVIYGLGGNDVIYGLRGDDIIVGGSGDDSLYGGYVGVAAGVAAWVLVYASSLFDSHGRGWHDKAAGTIVIQALRQAEPTQGREIPQKWQGWRGVPFS